jgi:hypothetical protein
MGAWFAPVAATLSDCDEEEEAELDKQDGDEEKGTQEDVGQLVFVEAGAVLVWQKRVAVWWRL